MHGAILDSLIISRWGGWGFNFSQFKIRYVRSPRFCKKLNGGYQGVYGVRGRPGSLVHSVCYNLRTGWASFYPSADAVHLTSSMVSDFLFIQIFIYENTPSHRGGAAAAVYRTQGPNNNGNREKKRGAAGRPRRRRLYFPPPARQGHTRPSPEFYTYVHTYVVLFDVKITVVVVVVTQQYI